MPAIKTSREEIIKESFKVFLKKGYYHTTVSDLSEACKIEKPHFYYYFKSKKDLMIAVLDFIKDWAIKNIFIHAYNKEIPPKERLNKLLIVLKSVYSKGFLGCIYSNTALETANNDEEFVLVIKDYFGLWNKALFEIYIEKFNKEEAERKSEKFFNELNGAILMMKLYRNQNYFDNFLNEHLNEL